MMPPPEYLLNLKEWAAAFTTIAAVFVLVCTPVGNWIRNLFKKHVQDPESLQDQQISEIKKQLAALEHASMATLRDRVVFLCEKYLEAGEITPRQFEVLTGLYESYRELGGNSFAHDLYESVRIMFQNGGKETYGQN